MTDSTGSDPSDGNGRLLARRLQDIHFRPIRADDWHKLQLFHHRLTQTTVGRRFHASKNSLSEPLAHRFTQLEGTGDVAIVATTGTRGRIVGVARYCRITDSTAEVAFVVEDELQGHGVGSRLLYHLRDMARQNGITEFVAEVLPGNIAMFQLLEKLGTTHTRYDQGVSEVRVRLGGSHETSTEILQ